MFRLNITVTEVVGKEKYCYEYVKLIVRFERLNEEAKRVHIKTALSSIIEKVGIPISFHWYRSVYEVHQDIIRRWVSLWLGKYVENVDICAESEGVYIAFQKPLKAREVWEIKNLIPEAGRKLWEAVREWALNCSREWPIDGEFNAYSFIPMVGGNQDEDSTKS